ncbi:16S rRNA (uracil(1498)-N(3))-methyltransferase [Candidatus Peregrinibacteria bacterium]|nr:16S rRNA (uracil(1498)-N(3))-methyltransferase [Candidatus Peregrinibacteria bacterium]
MRLRRVFAKDLSKEVISLDAGQENHIKNVLRLRYGAHILLFDGKGNECEAGILEGSPMRAKLFKSVISACDLPARVAMACALPKGKRSEFMFAKLCELGLAEFIPIICKRSVVKMALSKRSRLERIAIESSKQCGRSTVTKVGSEVALNELGDYEYKYIALPNAKRALIEELSFTRVPKDVLLIVGPEGGFTSEEEKKAIAFGAVPVKLCRTTLRVETAAISFMSILVNYVEKISS